MRRHTPGRVRQSHLRDLDVLFVARALRSDVPEPSGRIDVAVIQSLVRKGEVSESSSCNVVRCVTASMRRRRRRGAVLSTACR